MSVLGDGTQGSSASGDIRLSSDGSYAVWQTASAEFTPGDSNLAADIFMRGRAAGDVVRASVGTGGVEGNGSSYHPFISGSGGRFIAFYAHATTFTPFDGNERTDCFVHDRTTGDTARVSVGYGPESNGHCYDPTVSEDGRLVAFYSEASNLVPDDTNGRNDIFVHDRSNGTTVRVSTAADGTQFNGTSVWASISGDGHSVVFQSQSAYSPGGGSKSQIYLRDLQTGSLELISVSGTGAAGNGNSAAPAVSHDGRYVVFQSIASNLVAGDTNAEQDLFLRDRAAQNTIRVSVAANRSQASGQSRAAGITADGRYIVFTSAAANLVQNDTNRVADIFVWDRSSGQTMRVSVSADGAEANAVSDRPSISADGRWIGFESNASNLVSGDTNGTTDAFMTPNPLYDSDGDGAPDGRDSCPNDSGKSAPGACGCGTPDTDSDADGTPDCSDLCPLDYNKTVPGAAGCNAEDTIAPETTLEEYPRVPERVTSGAVPIDLETFAGVDLGDGRQYRIRYVVEIRSVRRAAVTAAGARSRIVKRIQRRNDKVRQHLPPGTYRARYKVQVVHARRVVHQTDWSPPRSFIVARRR